MVFSEFFSEKFCHRNIVLILDVRRIARHPKQLFLGHLRQLFCDPFVQPRKFVDDALRGFVDAGIDFHLVFAKIADNMAVVGIKMMVGMAQPSVLRYPQRLPFETKIARLQQICNMLILNVKHFSFLNVN